MTAALDIEQPGMPAQVPAPVVSSPRRLRGDLRFLRLYVYTVERSMTYRHHKEAGAADSAAASVVGRIERGLAGEAMRYRNVGWTILAVVLAPLLLSAFLWSAMYWLPVKYLWLPFERGMYGLPYFSLFEWGAYLIIAAYFVITWGYLNTSYDETGRLGTEYRRLAGASPEYRDQVVDVLRDGACPRTEFVLRKSKVFAEYAAALAEGQPS